MRTCIILVDAECSKIHVPQKIKLIQYRTYNKSLHFICLFLFRVDKTSCNTHTHSHPVSGIGRFVILYGEKNILSIGIYWFIWSFPIVIYVFDGMAGMKITINENKSLHDCVAKKNLIIDLHLLFWVELPRALYSLSPIFTLEVM